MTRAAEPNPLRQLPSVHHLLSQLQPSPLPRALRAELVRQELSAVRRNQGSMNEAALLSRIQATISHVSRQRLTPVINATGILLHTNLGRAPLARSAVTALAEVASGYSALEYDLNLGTRGARAGYVERCLARICESPAALVVNNCAAALVLVLTHLCRPRKRDVVISRGELVQIGGGFRIPEILQASRARLREVGTTNRTSLADYRDSINDRTALILKVHQSNFRMEGFVESASTAELASLARERNVPLVVDLGSGAVVAVERYGVAEHEPTPAEVLAQGSDLVTFSGDKLFGGPQAGIISGTDTLIAGLRKQPLFRALRCDKLVLAALQATAELYLDGRGEEIPTIQQLSTPPEALLARAKSIVAGIADLRATIGRGEGEVGGGTLPRSRLPSITIEISGAALKSILDRLRAGTPPVIAYIDDDRVKLDLRTVFPEQDEALANAVRHAISTS